MAFKGQEATVSKIGQVNYVACGYSFESSCHPGVDSGTQIKANVKLLISYAFVSMCVMFCNITLKFTATVSPVGA